MIENGVVCFSLFIALINEYVFAGALELFLSISTVMNEMVVCRSTARVSRPARSRLPTT